MEQKSSRCCSTHNREGKNVGGTERQLSAVAGGVLTFLAARQRSLPAALAGAGLLFRGLTGNCALYGALGVNTADNVKLRPLKHQVMVITGASSGIGLATARAAAKEGAKVVLSARSEDTLQHIVDRIKEDGGEAIAVYADVGDREQVEKIARTAIDQFGRIDTWVNDAGVSIYGRLERVSEMDSRRLFDTNFWGVVNGSLVALKYLRQNGGALINVGSEVSEEVIPLQGMYSASKHAVKGFTDALRIEVEKIDEAPVAITLIQPTAVSTPFPRHAKNYTEREPKLPTPQIDPYDVADAILDAATHHRRDVKVGTMAHVNVGIAKFLPFLGDKMSAMQEQRQLRDEPARHREGTLYEGGQAGVAHADAH